MSLKMSFDIAGSQPVLTAEKFIGNGSLSLCILTVFPGTQLGGVYIETKATHNNAAFSNGVGSGFVGLTPGILKGQRVIHNNRYVGQVVGNTDTTVTLTDLTYSGPATVCNLSSYTKLYTPAHYTLIGDTINMVSPIQANQILHAVPIDTLAMYFSGAIGSTVSEDASIYLRRGDDGFEYILLQVASEDTSLFPYHAAVNSVVFADGVGTGFSGLPVDGLIGKALNHGGNFVGTIVSNTISTVTISDNTYTSAAATAEVYNVGTLQFSLDGVTFAPVVQPPDLTATGVEVIRVYVKDTVKIPVAALNYPSNIIKVTGVEYIA